MANVSAVISNIRNIMRQDRGISGDAQRLYSEQVGFEYFKYSIYFEHSLTVFMRKVDGGGFDKR